MKKAIAHNTSGKSRRRPSLVANTGVSAGARAGERQVQPWYAPHASDNHQQLLLTLRALADDIRLQVLRVLQQESFSVQELCSILQLAQPALSHHLKLLHEAQLLTKRREGNSIYYRRNASLDNALTYAMFAQIDALELAQETCARMDSVQDQRRAQGQAFFTNNANALATQQARICHSSVYADSTMDMIARQGAATKRALEVGPGDGVLALRLAALFDEVLAIDSSQEMLAQTAKAVGVCDNLKLRCQAFEKIGKSNRFDLIMASMVIHHMPSPAEFFSTAQQLLSQRGLLLVAELCPHDQHWALEACGDLWLGFEPQELSHWAQGAGLTCYESQYLAQRNGFRIQLLAFGRAANPTNATHSK